MPRINRTLDSLTRPERELLALGELGSVEGVVPFAYVDGPNGVRGTAGATSFPAALVLGASFDRDLAREYGERLAHEVKAAGANVLLGPAMDILRVPRAGRSAESFGEDPLVNGELGGSVVAGVQSSGVLCIAKHFVANNFEAGRTGSGSFMRRGAAVDIRVDDGPLHELYLAPFRRAVQRFGLLGLMASYNRLRGEYVAQNRAVLDLARAWGFRGVIAPDFLFAVRDVDAATAAGLDLPGLDAPAGRSPGQVAALDDDTLAAIADHVLAAGGGAAIEPHAADPSALGRPEAIELAERIAVAGAVLLANDGVLPFGAGASIAVVGAERAADLLVMGGSASVPAPPERIAALPDALAGFGIHAHAVPGFTVDGLPVGLPLAEPIDDDWSTEFTTRLIAPTPGRYLLTLHFAGELEVELDGHAAITGFREASPMVVGPEYPLTAVVTAGVDPVELRVRYSTGPSIRIPGTPIAPHLRIGWAPIDGDLERAAEAAGAASAAVVVVGRVTGEAMDAESIRLPEEQELLIDEVAARQPQTVVVVLGSGPVVMPWRDRVSAVLHLGNAGERGMAALARVLAGEAEPGGRLPFSVPESEADVPLDERGYPGVDGVAHYDEGFEVGYRAYDARHIEPAFPFGHGLGYARIEWDAPAVSATSTGIRVEVGIRNASARDGIAVPQVYVTAPSGRRSLRAFASVRLAAGVSEVVTLDIPSEELAEFAADDWVVVPGEYLVEVARSSRDIVAGRVVVV